MTATALPQPWPTNHPADGQVYPDFASVHPSIEPEKSRPLGEGSRLRSGSKSQYPPPEDNRHSPHSTSHATQQLYERPQHFPLPPGHRDRDPTLRSKSAKRVSKSLPPGPQSHKQKSSLKVTKRQETTIVDSKDLPPPPHSSTPPPPSHGDLGQVPRQKRSDSNQDSHPPHPPRHHHQQQQQPSVPDLVAFVPYSPPPTKKGLVIDRPYSFYKSAPTEPQSVTLIDSPFGPPPGPAVVNQPPLYTNRARHPGDRPDPKDSIPTHSNQHPTMMAEHPTHGHFHGPHPGHPSRDRSHPDSYNRTISPRPDQNDNLRRNPSDMNMPTRSYSNGQSRQAYPQHSYEPQDQYRPQQQPHPHQHQHQHHSAHQPHPQHQPHSQQQNPPQQPQQPQQQQERSKKPKQETEVPPTRKGSGSNLLRMARQASDTAFRSVGLSRKSSDKKQAAAEENDTPQRKASGGKAKGQDASHAQNTPAQLHRQPSMPKVFESELGRNRSLPDIKPPSSSQHRGPARGSSLTHPKTQKSLHQHQIATAMSNTPITASTTDPSPAHAIQDAYGGTTDDWRQTQQAEKEALERQKLKDSSPTERLGHTSMNSVSTLNLPPITTAAATHATPKHSTSRILLPDRDRQQKSGSDQLTAKLSFKRTAEATLSEPTQESTSLARATMQPGGILSQLQAATEAGQVVDPSAGVWSQQEGRYIQRSNTAPYPARENQTILEEEVGLDGKVQGPLEYSKSEGSAAVTRHQRQPQRPTPPQDAHPSAHPHDHQQPPVGTYHHTHGQSQHEHQHQHQHQHPHQHQRQPTSPQQVQNHHTQQRQQTLTRNRAMSNESLKDSFGANGFAAVDKDLPPTPYRSPRPSQTSQAGQSRQRSESQTHRPTGQNQQNGHRSRSESQPETSRYQTFHQHPYGSAPQNARPAAPLTSEESVLALARSISPPPTTRRISHERNGSAGAGNLQRGPSAGQAPRSRYGLDMLPLPVIPSPDETLNKNGNVGILPQDVLRTLDSKTVQKVITMSVIASRVYKVLSFDEVETLKKEQEDLQKYVEALNVSLTIETRMRDASHSLIRLHESNTNIEAVKAATGQLHATTRKMDQIVQKTQSSLERLLMIQRLLLQHEGAVLNAGMRRLDSENRELSRAVIELETARDQEKEEKLKWKKEHTQLRIQSMIFPNPPGLDDLQPTLPNGGAIHEQQEKGRSSPSHPRNRTPPPHHQQQQQQHQQLQQQQQKHDARLAALENYMKELNEDISKKDERLGDLEGQLRMVKVWADEFATTLQARVGADSSVEQANSGLLAQLAQLQSKIENGFQALETTAIDMTLKAEAAEEAKNIALEFTATTLANSAQHAAQNNNHGLVGSPSSSGQSDASVRHSRSRPQDQKRTSAIAGRQQRGPYNRSKTSLNDNSDLNMVLNESLLELDQQISLDQSSMNGTSNSSSVSSGQEHPGRLSRNSSAHRYEKVPSPDSQLHRQHQQHNLQSQRQDLIRRISKSKQRLAGGEIKDDLVIGDAHEEIKRLNAMVDELERIVHLKMQ